MDFLLNCEWRKHVFLLWFFYIVGALLAAPGENSFR